MPLLVSMVLISGTAVAQHTATAPPVVPLMVDAGLALRVILTQKVRFKINEPVRGQITDPVFVFDREMIPPGTDITGRVVGFHRPSRWIRAWALMSGNFTPQREPVIEFDNLTFRNGSAMSISTEVTPGTALVVRFADTKSPPKGRIESAKELARQQIEARKQAVVNAVRAPGKMDRIKATLWSFLPYRPQSVPPGSRFTATLRSPLDFGTGTLEPSELDPSPSEALNDDVVNAVLTTALDSTASKRGTAVEAEVSQPVFSPDNHLIFPQGSHLTGTVVQAQPARFWHRNGKLAFMFTGVEVPPSPASPAMALMPIEGRLESVEVNGAAGDVRLDEEGGVTVANSKTRFIAPAVSGLLALRTTEGRDAEPDGDADDVGLKPGQTVAAETHLGPRVLAGGIGFGLLGAALGRLSQPISTVLGFYGAGRLAYSNIVGKGSEISFSKNTPMEIRLAPPIQPNPN
jgi:hypothetical protein